MKNSATKPTSATAGPNNLLGVLRSLYQWRKLLLAAILLVGIGSAVIALFLPEYFKSSTVFLAASPDRATPELLYGETYAPQLYGNEDDMDRILTIAESDELVSYLVDSFDLAAHYDIDVSSPRGRYSLAMHFRGLYEVTKTKRDAIQLDVEDKDPELAMRLARAARERINTLAQQLIKATQARTIATFEDDIKTKETQLRVLTDTLESLRKRYGIYNSEAQSESLTALLSLRESQLNSNRTKLGAYREKGGRFRDSVAIYEVKVAASEEEYRQLQSRLDTFGQGLAEVLTYTRQYQEANSKLSEDKEKLKQYQAVYGADIPALILVEEAEVPLIKSRPFRALIVLGSVVLTLFFLLVGILLYEAYRDLDWRSVYAD
jgi:tyrosine-protein kinase Etk/Wzc